MNQEWRPPQPSSIFGRRSTARSWRSPCPRRPDQPPRAINTHLALVADRFGYQAAQEIAR